MRRSQDAQAQCTCQDAGARVVKSQKYHRNHQPPSPHTRYRPEPDLLVLPVSTTSHMIWSCQKHIARTADVPIWQTICPVLRWTNTQMPSAIVCAAAAARSTCDDGCGTLWSECELLR